MGAELSTPPASSTFSSPTALQLTAHVAAQVGDISKEADRVVTQFTQDLAEMKEEIREIRVALDRAREADLKKQALIDTLLAEQRRRDLFTRMALAAGEESDAEVSLRKEVAALVDRATSRGVRRRGGHVPE